MSLKTTLKDKPGRTTKVYRTQDKYDGATAFKWWEESSSNERAKQLVATVDYLKSIQNFRLERASSYSRLYCGQPLMGFVGKSLNVVDRLRGLTPNRPTFNLVSAVVDTLVSKLTQERPQPIFLTDNGDYKERNLAKKLNNFILGELYQTRAYEVGERVLTDALVFGTGCVKVLETQENKVGIERVLLTELFVDMQESAYDDPRRLYQVKLMDRAMVEAMFPKEKRKAQESIPARIDNTAESTRSLADLIMVVEGWSLPSGENTGDGFHSIACSEGELFHEPWDKKKFPFVFLHHRKRQMGFWSMGTAEALMPTQIELNSILDTISRSIKLFGVPKVFVEEGSKVNKASFMNKIGVIIPYRGTAPVFAVNQSNAPELYEERARLIQFGFEQEGLSMLSATSQKPAGLNSGEAQRVYQDINSDRFASLERRYTNFYVDLSYIIIDKAMDIAKRDGKYTTVFTDRKKGCKEIELPDVSILQNPFVIQAYVQSSLPKDPAGRLQKVTEMMQSNMISIQEGRRLLDFPDLGQIETLANSSEERIFQYLDDIIDEGKYQGPDQFMDLVKATEICTQYLNLYSTCQLEEEKLQMLRDFFAEIQDLQMAAMPQPPMMPPPGPENQMAVPEPLPSNPMLPQGGPGGIPMMAEGGMVEDQKKNSNLDESSMPEWLQETRKTTVPMAKAAQNALNNIPGLDFLTKAFELTSPAVYAFQQAGNPKTEGSLIDQISHMPGSQLAADIPVGWKVLKGEGLSIQKIAEKIRNNKQIMEQITQDVPNTVKTTEQLEKYVSKADIKKWNELDQEIFNLQKELNQRPRSQQPNLEVTRTPEEIAAIQKEEALDSLKDFYRADMGEKLLKKLPLDEAAQQVIKEKKLYLKEQLSSWNSRLKDPFDQQLAKQRIKEIEEKIKGLDLISPAEVEDKMLEGQKRWEKITGETKQYYEQKAAQKAAEEERLKNVVVPVEIEGGPLPKNKAFSREVPNPKADLEDEISLINDKMDYLKRKADRGNIKADEEWNKLLKERNKLLKEADKIGKPEIVKPKKD